MREAILCSLGDSVLQMWAGCKAEGEKKLGGKGGGGDSEENQNKTSWHRKYPSVCWCFL